MPPEETSTAFRYFVCPQEGCNQISALEFAQKANSTDGPVDIGRIRCVQLHWFMMPLDRLEEM